MVENVLGVIIGLLTGVFVGIILGQGIGAQIERSKINKSSDTTIQIQKEKSTENEPILIHDDEKLTISYVEANQKGIRFLVQNKLKDVTITIQPYTIAINGLSTNNILMSSGISPNSKGYVNLQTEDFKDMDKRETISGTLNVIDFNNSFEPYEVTFTDISIK